MMSGGNEIGISPALLQAITHTISTKPVSIQPQGVSTLQNGDHGNMAADIGSRCEPARYPQVIKVEGQGHSMAQIQQAIAAIGQQAFQSGNTIFVVQNIEDKTGGEEVTSDHVSPAIKVENNSIHGDHITNENTSSVISLIASQVANQQADKLGKTVTNMETVETSTVPMQEYSLPYSKMPIRIKKLPEGFTQTNVPSNVNNMTVTEMENVVTETVVQTSYRPEPLENVENTENIGQSPMKKLRIIDMPEMDIENNENATTIILNPTQVGNGATAITTDQGAIVYRAVSSAIANVSAQTATQTTNMGGGEMLGGCPVCGDRVSGYHYGIYSCESCKGFFKRTVQNKKAFICHRMGECMVSMINRKKCPACRFKRCLVAGMKLEAIREDRTRGGRSSYDGCSPHRPVKLTKEPRRPPAPSRPNVILSPIVIQTTTGSITIPSAPTTSTYSIPPATLSSTPSPTAPSSIDLSQVQPQTPQLLEDLMAVESLMTEEEELQSCCEGKMVDGDTNLFSSLLHFADHCLYKIVRWARNLPDFASVSTDDQIVLLQNCWAELLCLSCCWKSIRSGPSTLKLCHGRTLSVDHARLMGLEDTVQRMLTFTENLRELETDSYEFVAMKGLLLLSPDVKNLKDESVIRKYQDRLIESLMIYTTTNSPGKADKFCQLLARIPELTRSCVLGKEQLTQRQQSGEVPQYSLLSELLKGDVVIA